MSSAAVAEPINKPREVEGVLDVYLIRPLGYALTLALRRTRVTPNMVSWLSVAAAASAALGYYRRDLGGAIWGSLFLLVSSALDSADGQLARATGRTSELGETLDGVCDNISFACIYLAALLGAVVGAGAPVLFTLVLGTAAGLSHALQSSLVDFERQLFLHYCLGRGRVEREDPAALREAIALGRSHGAGLWPLLLAKLRLSYCERQRRFLGSSVRLLEAYRAAAADAPRLREWFAPRYRAANRVRLGWWTLMASNSHKVGIVVCAFLPFTGAPVELARLGLVAFFYYDLALNVPLAALLWTQRRSDEALERELGDSPRA